VRARQGLSGQVLADGIVQPPSHQICTLFLQVY